MELHLRPLMGMWRREATVYLRERSRIVASIVSPFMWIAIVGVGIDRGLDPQGLPAGLSYLEFIVPGILAQAIMFGTIFYGVYIVWDRKMDVLKAVLVTPVPRSIIFFGKVIGGATQAIIEGALLLVVGWFFVPQLAWVNLPLVFVFVVLTAVLFTSFGLALGSYFTSFEGFRVTSTFIAFPVFFLSGALFPITGLPMWLTWFTRINPLTYSVDAIRGLLVGGLQLGLLLDFVVLSGFTVAAVLFGGWSFNRMRD